MSEIIDEREKIKNWVNRDLFNAYNNLLEHPEKILLAIIGRMAGEFTNDYILETFEALIMMMEERAHKLAKEVI